MEKIWAKDVKEGENVKSTFLVARKAVPTAKSGKTYLSITLQDKTGELEARAFDRVEELAAPFEEKGYIAIEGTIGTFQGKPQLRIEQASKVEIDPADAAEFLWAPPPEPKKPEKQGFSEQEESTWKELLAIVEAIVDPNVKGLVRAFLDDEDVVHRLRRAPAAKSVHHAYLGGLLEHTVSCLKLAHRLADHYPQVDRDLLVAGAFFHDLGKIRELSFDRQIDYTDEGRLVGHLVMTAQWIHDKARRVGVSRDLEQQIVHLVLSHHGCLEYGSPKLPMTLEAVLLHAIDDLDSRINSWLNLMGREGGSRRWTDANNIYEQHIWRGALPTAQAEKKSPPAEVMTPVIYVPREQGPQRRATQNQANKKKNKRPEQHKHEAPRGSEASATSAPSENKAKVEGEPTAPHHERPPRPERGGERGGGSFRGAPGDRKRGYTGPRLPGDKGPQPRPKSTSALTHNPFAALAQKIEGGESAEAPAAAPEPPPAAAPVTSPAPSEAAPSAVEAPTPAPASPEASGSEGSKDHEG